MRHTNWRLTSFTCPAPQATLASRPLLSKIEPHQSHTPTSERLHYRRLQAEDERVFHSLLGDEHVREFLCDGQVMPLDWVRSAIADSDALFARLGLGLWLVTERVPEQARPQPVMGFCGYRVFADMHPHPQLLYALLEPHTGRGRATEMARACVDCGRAAGMTVIHAAVDEPNRASRRVLDKLGFAVVGETTGAFGPTLLYELSA